VTLSKSDCGHDTLNLCSFCLSAPFQRVPSTSWLRPRALVQDMTLRSWTASWNRCWVLA
jgi:hypothetical protein